jgi:hypothetical protein
MKIVAANLLLAGTVVFAANLPLLPKLGQYLATEGEVRTASPDHSLWDDLLQKHVSPEGKVDYKGFRKDSPKLDDYLEILANSPVKSDWSRSEKMAYWINAYNAFTIKLVLDHYPVSSIRDIHKGNPWDLKWIKLGGETYSLNNIENDILRPQFKDARIHFAVNCAARSCPPLLNKAFLPENLDKMLTEQTQKFINSPAFNTIEGDSVLISRIFEWYAEDFGNIRDYLNKYSISRISPSASVQYQEYDWGLND